nr:MAG TPA: SCIMP protein [Inoviridae sp.]
MTDEEMIFEEQIVQETTPEEVENHEEQTEQDAANSLDDILAGVNELLEQSASYNAYLEEGESEPENPIIAYDNGNALALSDLDALAVQAANSSVYPGTWSGSILDYFSAVMRQNPGKHYVAFRNSQYSYFLYYGDDLTFSDGVVSGSADYVEYNYNNNNYVVARGNDNVNINISSGVVYTDLNSAYGALDGASEITLQTVLLVSVLVCLGFSLLCRILFRR